MHTVIKGTKTVDEYKKLKSLMEEKAQEHFSNHKNAFDNWNKGEIKKVWFDCETNLCIEYTNGEWFHYNDNGEWW